MHLWSHLVDIVLAQVGNVFIRLLMIPMFIVHGTLTSCVWCSERMQFGVQFAETLRLRGAILVVREPARDNFSFRDWHIKRNEALSMSTRIEAMNNEIWNTGGDGDPHPLHTIEADCFELNPEGGEAKQDDGRSIAG